MRKQIVSTMLDKNNLKISRKAISAATCCLTQRTYQLGLHLRRFIWIHKCFRIYSINGIRIQMGLHCSVNPRTFIWVQNIHSRLWIKNLWTHDKSETFWFQIHESAFYRLSSSFWPLFLFQQLLKKKKGWYKTISHTFLFRSLLHFHSSLFLNYNLLFHSTFHLDLFRDHNFLLGSFLDGSGFNLLYVVSRNIASFFGC